MEFGVTEEGNVNHDCHAGNQLEVTVGTEEGSFCFHQANGVCERTDNIVSQTVLLVVLTAGNVNLDTTHAGLQHVLGQTQSLTHVVQQVLLTLGEHAVDGNGVTEGTGVAVDTGSDTDHDQFAVLHLTVGCGGNDCLCSCTGTNDAGICKAVSAILAADCFACCGNFEFVCAGLDGGKHLIVCLVTQSGGSLQLLHFPCGLVSTQVFVLVGDIHHLYALETGGEVQINLVRNGGGANQTDTLQFGAFCLQLSIQLCEVDDGSIGVLFFGNHEYGETANLSDGCFCLCEGFRLGAAQQNGLAFHGNQNGALFKLAAPAGQVPAVGHIQLIKINQSCIQMLVTENLANLSQSVFSFLHVVVRHKCISFT